MHQSTSRVLCMQLYCDSSDHNTRTSLFTAHDVVYSATNEQLSCVYSGDVCVIEPVSASSYLRGKVAPSPAALWEDYSDSYCRGNSPSLCGNISFSDLCFPPRGEEIRRVICRDSWIKKHISSAQTVCIIVPPPVLLKN